MNFGSKAMSQEADLFLVDRDLYGFALRGVEIGYHALTSQFLSPSKSCLGGRP